MAIRVRQPGDPTFGERSSTALGSQGAPKKILKKVLTLTGEVQYERGWLEKRQGTFAR
jgi:hypothetical protein